MHHLRALAEIATIVCVGTLGWGEVSTHAEERNGKGDDAHDKERSTVARGIAALLAALRLLVTTKQRRV